MPCRKKQPSKRSPPQEGGATVQPAQPKEAEEAQHCVQQCGAFTRCMCSSACVTNPINMHVENFAVCPAHVLALGY